MGSCVQNFLKAAVLCCLLALSLQVSAALRDPDPKSALPDDLKPSAELAFTLGDLRHDRVERADIAEHFRNSLIRAHALHFSVSKSELFKAETFFSRLLSGLFNPETIQVEVCPDAKRDDVIHYFKRDPSPLSAEVLRCVTVETGPFELDFETFKTLPGSRMLDLIGSGSASDDDKVSGAAGLLKTGEDNKRDYYEIYVSLPYRGGIYLEVRRLKIPKDEEIERDLYSLLSLTSYDEQVLESDLPLTVERIGLCDPLLAFGKVSTSEQQAFFRALSDAVSSSDQLVLNPFALLPPLTSSVSAVSDVSRRTAAGKAFAVQESNASFAERMEAFWQHFASQDFSQAASLKEELDRQLVALRFAGQVKKLTSAAGKNSFASFEEISRDFVNHNDLIKRHRRAAHSEEYEILPLWYQHQDSFHELSFELRFLMGDERMLSPLIFYRKQAVIAKDGMKTMILTLRGKSRNLERGVREIRFADDKPQAVVQKLGSMITVSLRVHEEGRLSGLCADLQSRSVAFEEYGCELKINSSRDFAVKPKLALNTQLKRYREDGSLLYTVDIVNGQAVLEERFSPDGQKLYSRSIKDGRRDGRTLIYHAQGPLAGKLFLDLVYQDDKLIAGKCASGRPLTPDELAMADSGREVYCSPFNAYDAESAKLAADNLSDLKDFVAGYYQDFMPRSLFSAVGLLDLEHQLSQILDGKELSYFLGDRKLLLLRDVKLPFKDRIFTFRLILRRNAKHEIEVILFDNGKKMPGRYVYTAAVLNPMKPQQIEHTVLYAAEECRNYLHLLDSLDKIRAYDEDVLPYEKPFRRNLRAVDYFKLDFREQKASFYTLYPHRGSGGSYELNYIRGHELFKSKLIFDFTSYSLQADSDEIELVISQGSRLLERQKLPIL